jgi:hypothetical protein
MTQLAPFIALISIFIIMGNLVIGILNYRLKSQLLKSGELNDNALRFLQSFSRFGPDILKWGLVALFGGIGLVVLEYLPYDLNESPLPYGVESIFLSIAFLSYYFIMKKEKEKQ